MVTTSEFCENVRELIPRRSCLAKLARARTNKMRLGLIGQREQAERFRGERPVSSTTKLTAAGVRFPNFRGHHPQWSADPAAKPRYGPGQPRKRHGGETGRRSDKGNGTLRHVVSRLEPETQTMPPRGLIELLGLAEVTKRDPNRILVNPDRVAAGSSPVEADIYPVNPAGSGESYPKCSLGGGGEIPDLQGEPPINPLSRLEILQADSEPETLNKHGDFEA